MKTRKSLALLMALVMLVGLMAGCGGSGSASTTEEPAAEAPAAEQPAAEAPAAEEPAAEEPAAATADLPRNETLYFGGQQWGVVNGTNPLSSNNNNGMAVAANARGSRTIMFETLYMYNALDGKLYPLLADGDYKWNDDLTEMTVAIKPAAKWSDGSALTADDVAATWAAIGKVENGTWADYSAYIESVEAVDGKVVIKAKKTEDGKPVNPLQVLNFLSGVYVIQAKWLDTLFARNGDDATKILEDPAEDVVFSGPYGPYIYNDQLASYVRNDDYWGQDASMWGKLPVP